MAKGMSEAQMKSALNTFNAGRRAGGRKMEATELQVWLRESRRGGGAHGRVRPRERRFDAE